MSDDDRIRRGDAKAVARRPFLPFSLGGDLICDPEQGECTANAIDRIPAVTPALDAAAMQRMAAEAAWSVGGGDRWTRGACQEAILALPLPTPADRLADARKLPEVAAMLSANDGE